MKLLFQLSLLFSALTICAAIGLSFRVAAQTDTDRQDQTSLRESPGQDPDVLRQKAFALLKEGKWQLANLIFLDILAIEGNDYLSLYGNGLALFNLQRPIDAEVNVEKAITLLERDRKNDRLLADSLVLSALISASKGQTPNVLEKLERATKLAPDHFDAIFSLGRAYFGNGNINGAVSSFGRAVKIQPENLRARFFFATALERSGDSEKALAQYRAMVGLDPNDPQGNLGIGVLLVKLEGDKSVEGVAALRKAVSSNGSLYEARITLGKALLRTGGAEEAVEHLTKAVELAPENPEPHYQLALAFRKLGKTAEAEFQMGIVKEIHEKRRTIKQK